jgi:hypothetical protein
MIKAVDHERHNLKSSLLWQGCIEIFQCLSGPAATRAKSICRRKSRMVGKPEAIRAANWSAIVSTGDKSLFHLNTSQSRRWDEQTAQTCAIACFR